MHLDGMPILSHDGLEPWPKLGDCFTKSSAIAHYLVPDRLDALLEGFQRREQLTVVLVYFLLREIPEILVQRVGVRRLRGPLIFCDKIVTELISQISLHHVAGVRS